MSHHKRRKPRSKVRCTLCTDDRENIGGVRQQERRIAFAQNVNPNDGGCDCCDLGQICGCECHE